MKRIVYLHPGDMVEMRVIQDPDLPNSYAEWRGQLHVQQETVLLRYHGNRHLAVADQTMLIDSDFGNKFSPTKAEPTGEQL